MESVCWGQSFFYPCTNCLARANVGGIAAMVIGAGVAAAVSRLFSWPTPISSEAIAVAFLFAAAVGVCFGFDPARRAAGLDPIEALPYE